MQSIKNKILDTFAKNKHAIYFGIRFGAFLFLYNFIYVFFFSYKRFDLPEYLKRYLFVDMWGYARGDCCEIILFFTMRSYPILYLLATIIYFIKTEKNKLDNKVLYSYFVIMCSTFWVVSTLDFSAFFLINLFGCNLIGTILGFYKEPVQAFLPGLIAALIIAKLRKIAIKPHKDFSTISLILILLIIPFLIGIPFGIPSANIQEFEKQKMPRPVKVDLKI